MNLREKKTIKPKLVNKKALKPKAVKEKTLKPKAVKKKILKKKVDKKQTQKKTVSPTSTVKHRTCPQRANTKKVTKPKLTLKQTKKTRIVKKPEDREKNIIQLVDWKKQKICCGSVLIGPQKQVLIDPKYIEAHDDVCMFESVKHIIGDEKSSQEKFPKESPKVIKKVKTSTRLQKEKNIIKKI